MWPPEHLALGYILYSGVRRLLGQRPPTDAAAVALAFGTQFPDLVDKPLAWTLDVLPGGRTLAHSLFTALAVAAVVVPVARRRDRQAVGVAFVAGYFAHLLGDVLYPLLAGGDPGYRFLLWPLTERRFEEGASFLGELSRLLADFGAFLGTPEGRVYLLVELGFLAVALVLWVRDGRPGPGIVPAGSSESTPDRR